jgi:hypothetical protein
LNGLTSNTHLYLGGRRQSIDSERIPYSLGLNLLPACDCPRITVEISAITLLKSPATEILTEIGCYQQLRLTFRHTAAEIRQHQWALAS